MKKLALDLDTLSVESFATGNAADARGTVAAHWLRPTLKTICDSTLLASNPTCCPCTPRHLEI
ncbi:MAG TPA: hypothetical protein VFS20_15970 [Longimicrobium sp.]|nr:hypothetical protein [Longimicrobium sp.]